MYVENDSVRIGYQLGQIYSAFGKVSDASCGGGERHVLTCSAPVHLVLDVVIAQCHG